MKAAKEKIDQINKRLEDGYLAAKEESVKEIIAHVRSLGDKAIREYSLKFDGCEYEADEQTGDNFCPFAVRINPQNLSYFKSLNPELQEALLKAKERVEKFHQQEFIESKLQQGWSYKGPLGETLGVKYEPLDSVAVYIPGGQAPLISTVLMTAIPAKVAGVKRVVMVSPPPVNDAVLAAAELAAVDEVYAIGGAQAIAAMAYGTRTIKPVDKIVGPGNIYVSIAKKLVFGQVGIDGIYGPSELAILADDSAKASHVAADLISQLEHGSGLESSLLVTTSEELASDVREEFHKQVDSMLYPKEGEAKSPKTIYKSEDQIKTIKQSFDHWSDLIVVNSLEEGIELINYYAPEHLELQLKDAVLEETIKNIKNAGAIFVGKNSCESLGDYLAGPSHCLPTGGTCRFSSGLQTADFLKKTSIVDFSKVNDKADDFQDLIKDVALIARAEMLEGHARAMEERN